MQDDVAKGVMTCLQRINTECVPGADRLREARLSRRRALY